MNSSEAMQYCTFKVGKNFFGIPVLDVQEVIKPLSITQVPLANSKTRGLINLRGQIVTLIGLRPMFNLEQTDDTQSMNVVVKSNDTLSALIVDQIHDVMDVDMDTFEKTPATLDPGIRPFTKGIHKLKDGLLIVLDLPSILES